MGLGQFIRKQFVDVIQWTETEEGVLAFRFPMADQEIQYGAMLTVREGQLSLFVNEGRVADVLGPGLHQLDTRNIPVLTDLLHWANGFESPFKSDIYFFSTRLQTAQRWGTASPVTIRDREFGAVRLRGYGQYAYTIGDPAVFHRSVSGTRDVYLAADLEAHLRNQVVQQVATTFASSEIPFLDMAANQVALGDRIAAELAPHFESIGLSLASFTIEGLTLPEELQARLDERIGMNMVGDIAAYARYQAARALPIAAANPGGAAGAGVGIGAGVAMGKTLLEE